jgi:hypothetical protein
MDISANFQHRIRPSADFLDRLCGDQPSCLSRHRFEYIRRFEVWPLRRFGRCGRRRLRIHTVTDVFARGCEACNKGVIKPGANNVPGIEALMTADLMVVFTRFQN